MTYVVIPPAPSTGTATSVGLALPASIFAVTGSPVTASGTLTGALITQVPNQIWAGPASGAVAGLPAFRALVALDIPALPYLTSVALTVMSDMLVTGSPITSAGTLTITRVSQAANLVMASPNGAAGIPTYRSLVTTDLPTGIGTVTSVALTAPTAEFSVTGSPVVSAGTINVVKATQNANYVWAGAASGGAAAVPTFRPLVALDVPIIPATQVSGLAPSATIDTTNATNITTGALALARISVTGATTGQALVYNGTAYAPAAVGSGTVTSVALAAPGDWIVSGSPITGAGTITLSRGTQTAATVMAGPLTGVAAIPTFRALATTDLPIIPATQISGLAASATTDTTNATNITTGALALARLAVTGAVTGQALVYNGTAYAPAAVGTVTSVALAAPADLLITGSPVTGNGTLTIGRTTQTAATVFAGPVTGVAAVPTYRVLASTDIPTIPAAQVSGLAPSATIDTTNASNITSGALAAARIAVTGATTGQALVYNGTAYAPASVGTVTSVALTAPGDFIITGSPLTGAGTLAITRNTQTAATVMAGPITGAAAVPTYRLLAATDIPTIAATQVSGLAASATIDTTNATNITTGALALARLSVTGALTGNVLTYNGTAYAPAAPAIPPVDLAWILGDGLDGAYTSTTAITLTRDMYYTNLTLSTGGVITTAGYKIHVTGTLDATLAPAGAIKFGSVVGNQSVGGGSTGGAGAAGVLNAGALGTAANGGVIRGGNGGNSGAGGASGGALAGGASVVQTAVQFPVQRFSPILLKGNQSVVGGQGGAGGSSGAGTSTVVGGAGGAGGIGAGVVFISCNILNRGASTAVAAITSDAGTGVTGTTTATATVAGGGGGGGGGGGWVVLSYFSTLGVAATNTISVSGGNGGNGGAGATTGFGGTGGTGGSGGVVQVWNLTLGTNVTSVGVAGAAGTAGVVITAGTGGLGSVFRVNL